ncbi:MAG: diphosphomevalonate decarboxylase, partial [Bacteriovoracaceae bacterium]
MVNSIEYSAPSNIALIKYWGKRGIQIPQNPSMSFTLSHSVTKTKMTWAEGSSQTLFLFEGQPAPGFEAKVLNFRKTWEEKYPVLKNLDLSIESSNTFPHSAVIASSASSMASLSLCFAHIVSKLSKDETPENEFLEEASSFARLGSGSACRSLFGGVVTWGEWNNNTSNQFASKVEALPESWNDWGDAILIVSSKEKPVSSREGHALMDSHPYANTRYKEATDRVSELYKIMKEERLMDFCELVEKEALELHGLMMNSTPSFILMRPESLGVIEKVRAFRKKTGLPVCFTLDAGPNVHLLYALKHKEEVKDF